MDISAKNIVFSVDFQNLASLILMQLEIQISSKIAIKHSKNAV